MQIKKALTSVLVAGVFLFTATAALADTIGNTTGGVTAGCSGCTAGIVCSAVCPGINNNVTGPESTNENRTNINNSDVVVIDNIANAVDDMMFSVDTGCQEISDNTVIGSVSGGDITGNVVVMQDLNSSHIVMPAVANNSVVAPISMGNAITGPNSTNINSALIRNNSTTSINNSATYTGNYNFDVNSGGVMVGNNTSVGNISTGDVDLSLIENVSLNRNASNIVLPADNTEIVVPDMGNNTTGPGSTNENSFRYINNREITINNSADISNNINADINTGGNVISGNTCVGNVSTGSVNFNVNVSSAAN